MVDWSKYFTYSDGKLFYVPSSGRWRVRVQSGKKRKSYGSYNTLEEAKAVRDRVMKEIEESKDGE